MCKLSPILSAVTSMSCLGGYTISVPENNNRKLVYMKQVGVVGPVNIHLSL